MARRISEDAMIVLAGFAFGALFAALFIVPKMAPETDMKATNWPIQPNVSQAEQSDQLVTKTSDEVEHQK